MRKRFIYTTALVTSMLLMSAMPASEVITRDGATTIVNTQTLTKGVKGYRGNTPLKIYIKKDKIAKIETLKNYETPDYFAKAAAILKKWEGKTVENAKTLKVDGVTGATMSSDALKKNVKAGLEYYEKNK